MIFVLGEKRIDVQTPTCAENCHKLCNSAMSTPEFTHQIGELRCQCAPTCRLKLSTGRLTSYQHATFIKTVHGLSRRRREEDTPGIVSFF